MKRDEGALGLAEDSYSSAWSFDLLESLFQSALHKGESGAGAAAEGKKGRWSSGDAAGGSCLLDQVGAGRRGNCSLETHQKPSSAVSVEKFQMLLAGLQRYPAISEDASRLLFGFFFLSLLFSPQKNKPNHRAGRMMVLFNISSYEYQIRLQTPEKSLFLHS